MGKRRIGLERSTPRPLDDLERKLTSSRSDHDETPPLDLERTVEDFLWLLLQSYDVRAIYVDPYQMHRSISALAKAGAPVIEFRRNLVLYPDPDLRQQALHTVAIETGRGFRITKEKASNKIDDIVALSMACVAALDQPEGSRLPTPEEEAEDLRSLRAFEHHMGWPLTPWGGWQNDVGDGLSAPDMTIRVTMGGGSCDRRTRRCHHDHAVLAVSAQIGERLLAGPRDPHDQLCGRQKALARIAASTDAGSPVNYSTNFGS